MTTEFDEEIRAASQQAEADFTSFEFRSMLSGPNDHCNAFVTIHAGAAGTEACDWAEMLLRMYLMWAESKGFKAEITDREDGGAAGIQEATVHIKGDYAYGYLRGETGVHRLVRISPFDSAARRHTSFASVDVLPEVDDTIDIVLTRRRPQARRLPLGRARRPAPEQDRVRRPLYPPPDRRRRRVPQRALAAQERHQRTGAPEGQAHPPGGGEARGRIRQEVRRERRGQLRQPDPLVRPPAVPARQGRCGPATRSAIPAPSSTAGSTASSSRTCGRSWRERVPRRARPESSMATSAESEFHAAIDDERASLVGPGFRRRSSASSPTAGPTRSSVPNRATELASSSDAGSATSPVLAHREPCLPGTAAPWTGDRADPLPPVDRALVRPSFLGGGDVVAPTPRSAGASCSTFDVADRCRSPSRVWRRLISLIWTPARWWRPIRERSSGELRAEPGPPRAGGRAAGLARTGRGRPKGDASPGPCGNPAGEVHSSPALPMALDQRSAPHAVDRIAALDVEQLERAGLLAGGQARRRCDDVAGVCRTARAAR